MQYLKWVCELILHFKTEKKRKEMSDKKGREKKKWHAEMTKKISKLYQEGYVQCEIALLLDKSSNGGDEEQVKLSEEFSEELKLLIQKHTRHTNLQMRKEIIKLHNQGYNQREIARRVGVSIATVNLWVNRHGSLESIQKTGRLRKTTTGQDKEIYLMSQNDPFLAATDINRYLKLNVCAQTVRNRLQEQGLRNFKAPQKPFLLETHKQRRLEFAEKYHLWSADKWEKIACFADEKTFQSFGKGITRVWRPKLTRWDEKSRDPNMITRFNQSVISEYKVSGRFSISLWGCIGKLNQLHRVTIKRLNHNYFINDILDVYMPIDDDEFLLVHDNAPIHTAKNVKKWLSERNIKTIEWPAYSPDLNPIENLWSRMEYLTRNRTPTSTENLWNIVRQAYEEISNDKDYIQTLVRSMPKRLAEVLRVHGNVTKY